MYEKNIIWLTWDRSAWSGCASSKGSCPEDSFPRCFMCEHRFKAKKKFQNCSIPYFPTLVASNISVQIQQSLGSGETLMCLSNPPKWGFFIYFNGRCNPVCLSFFVSPSYVQSLFLPQGNELRASYTGVLLKSQLGVTISETCFIAMLNLFWWPSLQEGESNAHKNVKGLTEPHSSTVVVMRYCSVI